MRSPSVERLGCQEPTLLHLPSDRHGNAVDEAVDLAAVAGLHLDPWQRDGLEGALWERPDGRWSATEVCCVVGRQNGKGSILEARQIAGLFLFGERLQLHSAHEWRTCVEHFRRVRDLIEGSPPLMDRVKIIKTGSIEQVIELKTGERIRFLARSGKSGRGFTADVVYLDEAFELDVEVMGALLPTLSARRNKQIWYTSSAPHARSHFLQSVIDRARAGTDPRLFMQAWLSEPDIDISDPEVWWRVNPAMGIRIDLEFVENEYRTLTAAGDEGRIEFARERAGVPETERGGDWSVIPSATWAAVCDGMHAADGRIVFAVEVTPDRSAASIVACSEDRVVEMVDHRPGTGWLVGRLAELRRNHDRRLITTVIDKGGPTGSLEDDIRRATGRLHCFSGGDIARATSAFYDAVADGEVRVRSHPDIDSAVAGARKRSSGDAWVWDRRDDSVDVSPLVAATLAHWTVKSRRHGFFLAVT